MAVPFPFKNFEAASRKNVLVNFGLFQANDNIDWIVGSSTTTPFTLTGVIDGVNRVFTIPMWVGGGISIYRNGVQQWPGTTYTISGSTITFATTDVPQVGDGMYCLAS